MQKKSLYIVLLSFLTITLNAQISFTDSSDKLNVSTRTAAPVAVADLNGDYLDDIIRLDNANDLEIEYQDQDGNFTSFSMNNASSGAWAICVADINNDGLCEIMSGGSYNGVNLLSPVGDGTYTKNTLDGPSLFVQGMNFADINNDGFLDAFSCHDDATSHVWANDGTGNLSYSQTELIDLHKYEGEQGAGNYGSVWTDFDSDGDLDLYIAKCRQGVNNNQDVRRINQLWVNDGNNNYTEDAASYGLDIGWQSWTAEFQDIDNDGDMDCFITNHDHESQLFENVDNNFVDITATSGINITSLPVQAAMKDFDNDGFVDLLVTGHFYHNNGDKTFTEVDLFPGIHSFGLGDLNHDGFLDVYAGYGNGFNGTGNQDDKLWLSNGNTNNWFGVNLVGQQSNRGGVGARIELHGAWGVMVREVRAGESYGIGHSLSQHFGLGGKSAITSITVRWPSGIVDIIENPAINQFVTIIENNCIALDAPIVTDGATTLCEGETVGIYAPIGYTYMWSNGETTQSITVGNEGNYAVTIADAEGCFGISQSIGVLFEPEEVLTVTASDELSFCQGSSIELTASEGTNYLWSTGTTAQSITVTESGTYEVSADGFCTTIQSETLVVDVFAAANAPQGTGADIPEPGTAILSATGTNLTWYANEVGGDVLGTGNTFETPYIEESTTFYVQDALEYGGAPGSGGALEHTGTSEFSGNQFNGELIFDCMEPFTFKTAKVYTDIEGDRIIELRDAAGNVLQSKQVFLPEGESILALDFYITPDENLSLTTNTEFNQMTYGNANPRMRRTSESSGGAIDYPYDVSGAAILKESNFGPAWYYYFYDIKIELESVECPSPRTAVEATINMESGVFSVAENDAIQVFPNPTSNTINIAIEAGNVFQYRLIDMTGKVLVQNKIDAQAHQNKAQINVAHLAEGMYWLQFMDKEHVYNTKITIVR